MCIRDRAWFKSIEDIHNRLKQKGASLSLQVDVTATPKHNNGAIFVQTVADYPLVEAITQNVVKHPVLPDAASRAKLVERKSAKFTEKYADYINPVSYTHLRAHETVLDLVCRLLLEKTKTTNNIKDSYPRRHKLHSE